ncbi:MAG: hypothetical protein ACI9C0_000847, partial [Alteromonadaceae bacterium]
MLITVKTKNKLISLCGASILSLSLLSAGMVNATEPTKLEL